MPTASPQETDEVPRPPLVRLARGRRPLPESLPVLPTPLVGREREVADLAALLARPDVRLATLTGPGGVGKTGLAIAVATELQHDFADGVAFAGLAPVTDPALVLPTIAQALGLREGGEEPLAEALRAFLRDRTLL